MTRRASSQPARRGQAERAKPTRARATARPATILPRLPPGPAAIRARTFTQWMVAGALAGIILSLAQAQNAWVDAGITSNIVQAIGAGLAMGLVARGACWIWLARQK